MTASPHPLLPQITLEHLLSVALLVATKPMLGRRLNAS